MERIHIVSDTVLADDKDVAFGQCDELGMRDGEGSSIGEVESERTETSTNPLTNDVQIEHGGFVRPFIFAVKTPCR